MTTYLIKITNNQTHHFRVVIDENIINIVEGVFYNWITKSAQRFENNELAEVEYEKLVEEKLKQGYQKSNFIETLENNMHVYDKAKWHFEGDFPEELNEFQAYVHTGMFLGCMIDSNLVSDQFIEDHLDEIKQFKERKLTGPQIFERCCDGTLIIDDINEAGNMFGMHYYDDNGDYINDYINALVGDLPSVYHVKDTWENYYTIKDIFEKRLAISKSKNNKSPFWKFW